MNETLHYEIAVIDGVSEKFAAIISEDTQKIFDYENVQPCNVKNGYRGMVPWGEDNQQPYHMLQHIKADEVMSSNLWFNIRTAYGKGFVVSENGHSLNDKVKKRFFRRNNMVKYWVEQLTDVKHFFFTVMVIILDREGDNVVRLYHKEAINCRFETCNPQTGRIENVFFANWENNPKDEDIEVIPLLDEDDPIGDLLVRLGREPDPKTGRSNSICRDRKFAIVNRIPTPGMKYYPFPYYCSTFNSGWANLKAMIPLAKIARMKNGMVVKYIVELHRDYFSMLFNSEKINDPEKKKKRKAKEINNIKNFLSGIDNQNKSWFSTYYIDPNGKEQKMVRIEHVGGFKEGGDYIEDAEEAANIVCYAQGVHPSLIGATPGKNKGSFSGSDKRELFTMKQAMERLTRDLLMMPFYIVNEVNEWDLDYDIPDLMLTTLDKNTDAMTATSKPKTS